MHWVLVLALFVLTRCAPKQISGDVRGAEYRDGKMLVYGELSPVGALKGFELAGSRFVARPSGAGLLLQSSGFINTKGRFWFAVLTGVPSGTESVSVDWTLGDPGRPGGLR